MTKLDPPGGNLDDLRAALFATLSGLRDKTNPLPVETATATVHVARELIATGRLELDFIKLMNDEDKPKSTFFSNEQEEEQDATKPAQISERTTGNGLETVTQVAGGNILQHRIR